MKQYVYKVYNAGRTNWDDAYFDVDFWNNQEELLVGVWSKEVISEPRFRSVLNGGTSQLNVRLGRNFTSYGEGGDVVHGYKVDVWCYDADAPNGTKIFSGFIAEYAPVYDQGEQYLEVVLLPYDVQLGTKILEDPSGYTARQYLSEDPSDILRDVLDQYRNNKAGRLTYSSDTIDDTGTVVSYTFNAVTIKEALDKIVQLAPEGWYYRVDPDGYIHFHERSELTGADHIVNVGKHITKIKPAQDITKLVNTVYFVGGTPEGSPQIYVKKQDNSSIASYGEWEHKQVDQRVTVDNTAETIAGNILEDRSQPVLIFDIEVVDNNESAGIRGYDIESLRPGDTIQVKGLYNEDFAVTTWDGALFDTAFWDAQREYTLTLPQVITSVEYSPGMARIEATYRLPDVSKRIEDINRNLEAMQFAEIPITPTNI